MRADWESDWVQTFGTGSASLSLFPSQPSEEQRKRWSMEDELRDARRLPLGFAAPPRGLKVSRAKRKRGS